LKNCRLHEIIKTWQFQPLLAFPFMQVWGLSANGLQEKRLAMRIFIPEPVPSFNKGEMAILEGTRRSFQKFADAEISLYSLFPDIDSERYNGIHIIRGKPIIPWSEKPLTRFQKTNKLLRSFLVHLLFLSLYRLLGNRILALMKSDIWRAHTEADLIVVGHDGTFNHRFAFVVWFCRRLRKRVVIYGAGVPSIKGTIKKKMARYALNSVDLVTVRETVSYRNLADLGAIFQHTHLTADLSFLMEPVSKERVNEIRKTEKINDISPVTGPVIGITALRGSVVVDRSFPAVRGVTEKQATHVRLLAGVIDRLIEKLGATVVFVPHCTGPGRFHDDRVFARDIFANIVHKARVVLIENEYSPEELRGLIGSFDLFIGERTHSLISAACMCVPFVAVCVPNDQRTHGILGEMMAQERWIYDLADPSPEALFSKIEEAWHERDAIRKNLKDRLADIKIMAGLNGKLLAEALQGEGNASSHPDPGSTQAPGAV
jgi:polysaccharide pyruvyl transferase WcaK-like protein